MYINEFCANFLQLWSRGQLKSDVTRAETKFVLSAKRTSPFKSAGASVQSTTGSRGVRITGSNAGYTMFRGSVKGTGYPLHSPVSPLHFPSRASPCAITFLLESTTALLRSPVQEFSLVLRFNVSLGNIFSPDICFWTSYCVREMYCSFLTL